MELAQAIDTAVWIEELQGGRFRINPNVPVARRQVIHAGMSCQACEHWAAKPKDRRCRVCHQWTNALSHAVVAAARVVTGPLFFCGSFTAHG